MFCTNKMFFKFFSQIFKASKFIPESTLIFTTLLGSFLAQESVQNFQTSYKFPQLLQGTTKIVKLLSTTTKKFQNLVKFIDLSKLQNFQLVKKITIREFTLDLTIVFAHIFWVRQQIENNTIATPTILAVRVPNYLKF
eukprot:TRINITY_DN13064_c1_g1_i3.p5 TRINITY_DN13064_c1_g1~~TRINITY_DN13064_c1_g1_i3.p5  ORF type:complete len:138 (+),score=0.25 TRINITY_DN13064_c1_g1_i3:778-1191(+)